MSPSEQPAAAGADHPAAAKAPTAPAPAAPAPAASVVVPLAPVSPRGAGTGTTVITHKAVGPAGTTTTRTVLPVATPRPRASTWVPDPRWAHPVSAAAWLLALATLAGPHVFALPAWALLPLAPVGAVIGMRRARRRWTADEHGEELPRAMAVLATVAAVGATGWAVYACLTDPLPAAGWLLLITVWVGGWYAHLRTSAVRAAAERVQAAEAAEEARETVARERTCATWDDILAGSSAKGLKVVEHRDTRAGYVIGLEPIDPSKPVSFATLHSALPELTTKAAALLAGEGTAVRAGMIRAEETDVAHVHLIHVGTRNVLSQSIPYEPAPPATIADPIDVGLYEDGQPLVEVVGGPEGGVSGKIVGATGSGKSTLTNSYFGRIGECVDGMNIVIGSSKVVPLVYPWLQPWLDGRSDQPALDGIFGQDPQRALVGLAAVYQIVCMRNDKLSTAPVHVVTRQAPAVVAWVEEAGDMAARLPAPTIVCHDGQVMSFSRLVHEITRQSRSAQVSLRLLNQNDLYDALGQYGPQIAGNTPFRVCLRTLRPQDGPSVLPGLKQAYSDTSRLRHHSMLVQPSIDDPRVMPAKSYRLEGDDIHPVAIANAARRPELEPDIVAALGDVWADRWRPEHLTELARAARAQGLSWPTGTAATMTTGAERADDTSENDMDEIDHELRKMLEEHAPADSIVPTEQGPPAGGWPDAEADMAALRAAATAPRLSVPEPLSSVLELLGQPGAPRDWVSTQTLAVLLKRVPADAPVAERRKAAERLGLELSALHDELRSKQQREDGSKVRGYDVALLKRLAGKIARGEK